MNEDSLTDDEKMLRAKRRVIDRILAGASDVQTLNGALLSYPSENQSIPKIICVANNRKGLLF